VVEKSAEILEFNGRYFFLAYSSSASGCIGDGERTSIQVRCSDYELGKMTLDTLDRCRKGLPAPTDWAAIAEKGLDETGAKSWKQLEKRGKYVSVEQDKTTCTVIPTVFNKIDGNYDDLDRKKTMHTIDVTPEELGKAIREALLLIP